MVLGFAPVLCAWLFTIIISVSEKTSYRILGEQSMVEGAGATLPALKEV
jgi:hypothetical protein